MFFLGADQEMNSEQLINALSKEPRNKEQSGNQGHFYRPRFLILVANASIGGAYVTTPCVSGELY